VQLFCDRLCSLDKKDLVNQTLRIPASLAFIILLALGLSNCGKENPAETATASSPAAPLSELDKMINDYENVVNEYVKMARRHQAGDMGVTMQLIEDEDAVTQMAAKLQQKSGEMNPTQAQRVAGISSRKAPYLK
jgi:hypothetical protein